MESVTITNIEKITINKNGIVINQNGGGIIKLSKEQINNIVER